MKRELTAFLGQNGFQEIGTNFPDVSFFIRRENTFVLCLYVVEATRDMPLSAAQLEELGKGIDAYLKTKALPEAHTLELLLSDSLPHADFLRGNRFRSWLVDTTSGKLYLPAGEDDFYGCRALLTDFLDHREAYVARTAGGEGDGAQSTERLPLRGKKKRFPYVTAAFVFGNVLVFLLCAFTGDLLYNRGVFHAEKIISGEGYRMLTSMFLHSDVHHLFGNMLLLFAAGDLVERYTGHIRLAVCYLVSGLAGNLADLCYELRIGESVESLGASGAVFGIIGAMLVLTILHRGRLEGVTVGRMAVVLLYLFYSGLVGWNVNNYAHIGGFIAGVATELGFALLTRGKRAVWGKERNGS